MRAPSGEVLFAFMGPSTMALANNSCSNTLFPQYVVLKPVPSPVNKETNCGSVDWHNWHVVNAMPTCYSQRLHSPVYPVKAPRPSIRATNRKQEMHAKCLRIHLTENRMPEASGFTIRWGELLISLFSNLFKKCWSIFSRLCAIATGPETFVAHRHDALLFASLCARQRKALSSTCVVERKCRESWPESLLLCELNYMISACVLWLNSSHKQIHEEHAKQLQH